MIRVDVYSREKIINKILFTMEKSCYKIKESVSKNKFKRGIHMICADVEVKISAGLTFTNLAYFIQKASVYRADVFVQKGRCRANAKSLLGLLSLGISDNDIVTISADGVDERMAVDELSAYLKS